VLENNNIQSKFIQNADAILDRARVDMVLLGSHAVPSANVVFSEFSAIGYRVFRLWKNDLVRVTSHEANVRGTYLAVRQDLAKALQSRGTPFYLDARNLLRRLYRSLVRQ
jgi:hypothetical protein